jgi:dihydroxyacetone kinase-like predicted kinase
MGGTVILLAENPENYQHATISKASKLVAEATILSAKGNSGAILAQFFQGLAEGFENLEAANIEQFSKAAKIAAVRSREAVSDPKEGTILTVIDDWSNHLVSTFNESEDLETQLNKSLIVAEKSLQHTKQQMEVLRKANVVDAGAQGFVYMLEGIVNYISHGTVQRDKWRKATKENISFQNGFDFEKTEFQFCTEALLSGDSIDRDKIREVLDPLGDSLVVVGSNTKVRVHIHTNNPGKVYEILRTFGKIIQEKIDDMDQQKKDVLGDIPRNIALVTDTSCDVPADLVEKYNILFHL